MASAEDLRQPVNRNQLSPFLRSGIYLFIPPIPASNTQAISSAVVYLIYWPEDETWNGDAFGSVRKNRVSFMRYLTKLTQDIRSLISEEHAAAFVWKHDDKNARGAAASDSSTDDESDDDDRFVKFKVQKSGQDEECVQIYPGFTVGSMTSTYHPQRLHSPTYCPESLSLPIHSLVTVTHRAPMHHPFLVKPVRLLWYPARTKQECKKRSSVEQLPEPGCDPSCRSQPFFLPNPMTDLMV